MTSANLKIKDAHSLAEAFALEPILRNQIPEQFVRDYESGVPKLTLRGKDLALCRVVIDFAQVENENTLILRMKLRALIDNNGEFVPQVSGRTDDPSSSWLVGFNSAKARFLKDTIFTSSDWDTLVAYAHRIEEIETNEGPGAFYEKHHASDRLYLTGDDAEFEFDLEIRTDQKSEEARFGLTNLGLGNVQLLGRGTSRIEEVRHLTSSAQKPETLTVPAVPPSIPARNAVATAPKGQALVMPPRRRAV